MKTKSDILAQIDSLNEYHSTKEESLKQDLFKLYENDKKIKAFLTRVENCNNPDNYSFDSFGMLISSYSPDFDLDAYPFFSEFVDSLMVGHFNEKESVMENCHGESVTINWNHDRSTYFVYDGESRKAIIEKKEKWMDETYVAAKIAQFQNEQGVFNEVVEIDYYGGYNGHFSLSSHLDAREVKNLDDKSGLDKIIERYESLNEEE